MNDHKVMNRWWAVFGAVMIQCCLGAIYAWSVFTPSLKKDFGWDATHTQAVFSCGLAVFALVMVLAGRLMSKCGPRCLAISGGVLLGLGYVLGGLVDPSNFWAILFFIGVVGGAGIGLAYVVPIAVGMRWFPDMKGVITGLAVAGFGFGALLWVKLADSWLNMIASLGLSNTFVIYGITFLFGVVIGGIWMVFPPEGWTPKGFVAATSAPGSKPVVGSIDFTSREMLKTPQFYMIFFTFVAGAGAGLMSIGLMKLFPMQALQANNYSYAEALAISGTAMAVFFSLANGIGRIVWGKVSDNLGRKVSLTIMMAIQGIAVLIFPLIAGQVILLYLLATVIGFNFGGNFSLFPTITADTFGSKQIGQNYPWVFLAYGVGGIAGPIMGGKLGDMGNFPLAFTICGVCCLAASLVIACVKTPKKA